MDKKGETSAKYARPRWSLQARVGIIYDERGFGKTLGSKAPYAHLALAVTSVFHIQHCAGGGAGAIGDNSLYETVLHSAVLCGSVV